MNLSYGGVFSQLVSYCITRNGKRLRQIRTATLIACRNKVKNIFFLALSLSNIDVNQRFLTVGQCCTFKTVNNQCMSISYSGLCELFFLNTATGCCLQILYQSKLNNLTGTGLHEKCPSCHFPWSENDKSQSGIQLCNKLAQRYLSIFLSVWPVYEIEKGHGCIKGPRRQHKEFRWISVQ